MYSCEIWANADPFCAGADPCIRKFVGHPRYVLGTLLLCYQYINLLWPMYSCEIWANADPFCAGADPCIRNFVGHPHYVLGTILLCYQYINLLWPMYSCEIWANADPFCAGADPCIRNLLEIHAMYWESYCYVTNILICYGRCIAVKFGQMPIHSVQVPIHASEILSDIHSMYQKYV